MTGIPRDPANPISQRLERWLLAAILLLAAGLRLGWPGLTEFKADEAHMVTLALDTIQGQGLAVRGMGNSVGLPNFPMSVWLYALPLALWPHVYSATLFTGLINTLAILGCWWIVRRYWGPGAALAAALMYTVSPWAVLYSRKIWAQNLLPPWVLGWAIAGLLAFVERRRRFILLHLLCLAVAVQIHLSALALIPATALLLIIFWRRVSWTWVLIGLGLGGLTALPFAYDLLSAGFSIHTALEATQQFQGSTDLTAWRYTWLLSTGREIHSLAGPEAFRDYLATAPEMSIVHGLWAAFILAGAAWLAWRVWRDRGDKTAQAGLLILLWGLAPPLFFLRHSTPVFPHYLIAVYPAQYVAAGVALALLRRWLRRVAWAALGASAIAQVWVWATLLAFVSSRATPGAAGTPLAMQLQAADLARSMLADQAAAEVLIAGPGESPDLDGFAAVYDTLLRGAAHRFIDANRSTLFPARPAVVLIDDALRQAAERYWTVAVRAERIPLRRGEGSLWVLTLPAGAMPEAAFRIEPTPQLANGVRLLGYDAPTPNGDGTATWRLYWQVGAASEADYHFFNHLLDAHGQRVAQADAAAFAARQWQAGDTVISRFTLPWPAEAARPLTMRSGMYTWPDVQNVPVLDVLGKPQTDAVEITLP
ncbi:MAG: ArnT family glycosyltransferase [Chloroflexota bacterium]